MHYAHTLPGRPECDWEPLRKHLDEVATLAEEHASAFGVVGLGRLAGRWHDLGKYAPEFQRYLRESYAAGRRTGMVDHSTAGAKHAASAVNDPMHRLALAFAIAGHHAGLADASGSEDASLKRRLTSPPPESKAAIEAARVAAADLLAPIQASVPRMIMDRCKPSSGAGLAQATLIRMLFSCLIDADRLATQRFTEPDTAAERSRPRPKVADLVASLDEHIDAKAAAKRGDPSPADVHRAALLAACREKAALPPGIFSLTAPTGSGKTLSSMAFALRHAAAYGMRRVIYALPFTTVTEQNAEEYRRAFAGHGDAVLEHHSAYDSERFRETGGQTPRAADADAGSFDPRERRRRMAAENWDAPVVVTTNVQLFESLFSAHPSDCRKLHRIARSVIVLDEAQTLPPNLLKPTLAILDELAASYGCSVVLCSATMPAVTHREGFQIGLRGVREIVPDPAAMADAMRRVQVEIPRDPADIEHNKVVSLTDDEIIDRLAAEPRCLLIVNTRKHARRLYELASFRLSANSGLYHLSALMCPAHRSERVAEIKARLVSREPCRVISTQVVEAGVDIDFPVVLRAMAGLDSIVQAAGRCNREGRLTSDDGRPVLGRVIVFETDETPPREIAAASGNTREVLTMGADPLDLSTIEHYFRQRYWSKSGGKPCQLDIGTAGPEMSSGITELLGVKPGANSGMPRLLFRSAAERYRLIDDYSVRVVVPWGEDGAKLCKELLAPRGSAAEALRKAQRYSVNVPPWSLEPLIESGVCVTTELGVTVLLPEHRGTHYSVDLGLLLDEKPDPAASFV